MFDSTAAQVLLGLALVFFVVASIASAVNEILSRLADARAKTLWTAIAKLVAPVVAVGPPAPPVAPPGPPVAPPATPVVVNQGLELRFSHALKFAKPKMGNDPRPTADGSNSLSDILQTPSVRVIDPESDSSKPTKIDALPGKVFAAALLELARAKGSGEELAARIQN
jgi:hypothetical protein